MTAPLVLAVAAGAAPRASVPVSVSGNNVAPAAAVTVTGRDAAGPVVVAVERPPQVLRTAGPHPPSSPPEVVTVNHVGASGIPDIALSAYRNAEQAMTAIDPGCGLGWNLLAGIGRIESLHANFGSTDIRGTAVQPIYGPALDGTLPGNEVIVDNGSDGEAGYVRAVGPMQFLPSTWARYSSDGDGDGVADPQNLYDSALAAARYLCAGGQDLREPGRALSAVLRYNHSTAYARSVLGWAAAYAGGVVPVELPPVMEPSPLGDPHLEASTGLGPGLPGNLHGLPSTGPLAGTALIDLGGSAADTAGPPAEPGEATAPEPRPGDS
ncbi:lytic transglycosylase domain-containing protein [Mycolicibacter senuensis]|uniref:lytic transglycosylase domain-containing protein n=1 Tax=Mycolicibacter senuensis TaxID=386913 RepID=UPI003F4AB613